MKDKQMLGDFIYSLRKEKGYSQSELGNLVGVSNKAVSKWETNEANPEIGILRKLAAVLGVTTDELLECQKTEDNICSDNNGGKNNRSEEDEEVPVFGIPFSFIKIKNGEYVSKRKTKKGTPYCHINFSSSSACAKGIIAIGYRAKGVISLGLVSMGLISIGLLPLGLISMGLLTVGLISLGMVSIGGIAAGGVAIGILAVGGVAIGYFSVGGIAIGYYAHTGLEGLAIGAKKYFHK